MWKEFFFLSKGERNGIIVLICLIVVVFAINTLLPYLSSDKYADPSEFKAERDAFLLSVKPKNKKENPFQQKKIFYFDPNTADSADFVRLGISASIAGRIEKYRAKGGKFKRPEDFSKIYGITEELYAGLLPYIQIADKKMKVSENKKETFERNVFSKNTPEIIWIELNSADTAALKKLKGVGPVYAERIVKYREYLGGFYSVGQLKEVYGISEELYLSIKPNLTVDETKIRKIELNKDKLSFRTRHPYLSKNQVKELIEMQKRKKIIRSIEELQELDEFTEKDINRLRPYLQFE